jgi:hypothetical protein
VAAQAARLAPILGEDGDLVEAAAWLHDIGYSPEVAATGFHPLDGARHLRDVERAEDMICRLVAHHTCAMAEAEERGLAAELSWEFAPARGDLMDALTFCDMTTGPDGDRVTPQRRLADIEARYGPGHQVTNAIRRASPQLLAAVARVADAAPGLRRELSR